MKNLFNLRPLLIGAVSLILGVVALANYMLNKTVFNLILLVLFLVAVAVVIGFIVYKIVKHNTKTLSFVTLVLSLSLVVISMCVTAIYLIPQSNISGKTEITAKIENVKIYDSYTKLNLTNVETSNKHLSGYTELVVFNYDNESNGLVAGNKIKATVTISTVDKNYSNINYVVNNINYKATCNVSNVETVSDSKTLKSVITLKVKENLNKHLNSDNAKIAYSVLFGEKENMSDVYTIFSYAGIAHILAVSGLHVGFVVVFLVGFLKLVRCNKHALNIITFLILLLYVYLCNFTPSVVRASVTSLVLLLSKTYGKEYDALSSLSFSAILILLISPLSIYSVGFQLSFVCVLSILTISKPIKQILFKIKCPKALTNSLAISLAVNLGVLAITAKHFNQISFISVLSNLVVLPVFSICFSMLFVTSFVGLLIPFVNYLLVVPNILLHFIKLMANFFANISFLNFKVFRFSYILVALALFAIYFIGYALVNRKVKSIVSCLIILLIIVSAVVINLPTNFKGNNGYTSSTYAGNYVLLTQNNNKTLILNQTESISNITSKLTELKVNKVNSLVVNNYSVKYNEQINTLISNYKIETLFIENTFKDVAYQTFSKNVYVKAFNECVSINNLNITIKYFNSTNIGLQFEIENNKVLMLNDSVTLTQLNNLSYENETYNFVLYNNVSVDFSSVGLNYHSLVDVKNL